jgi:hypothetical protein
MFDDGAAMSGRPCWYCRVVRWLVDRCYQDELATIQSSRLDALHRSTKGLHSVINRALRGKE